MTEEIGFEELTIGKGSQRLDQFGIAYLISV
jgi:hypothetical protein